MHRLRPNEGNALPQAIVCVDTETHQLPMMGRPMTVMHQLRLGVAQYWRLEAGKATRRDEVVFSTPERFWEWLYNKLHSRSPLWLWCHNLGFDWSVLRGWRELEEGRLKLWREHAPESVGSHGGGSLAQFTGLLVTEDPPSIFSLYDVQGRNLRCVDLCNWIHEPISKIGADLGLPKHTMPAVGDGDDCWESYCRRDVEILTAAVLRMCDMVRDCDLGNMRYTVAGQAWAAYRHRFVPTVGDAVLPERCDAVADIREKQIPVIAFHDRDDVKRLERAAYYGGKVWPHYIGEINKADSFRLEGIDTRERGTSLLYAGPVYHLDVVGCYPHVMRGTTFPCKLAQVHDDVSIDRLKTFVAGWSTVADVTVRTTTQTYPVRSGGETLYLWGTYRTALAGPELAAALANGHVTHCHRVACYHSAELFTDYVDTFWQYRVLAHRDGEWFDERIYKLLLNSLHGKFAQRQDRWEIVPGKEAARMWGQYYCDGSDGLPAGERRAIAGTLQVRLQGVEGTESFPAIAAYVSSYARLYIESLIDICPRGSVLYQDHDSIHVTQAAMDTPEMDSAVGSGRLGSLRRECKYDDAHYYGPRHYRLGGKLVQAGLASRHQWTDEGQVRQEAWQRLDGQLQGVPPAGPLTEIVEISPPVHLVRGRVTIGGWVEPLIAGVGVTLDEPAWLNKEE